MTGAWQCDSDGNRELQRQAIARATPEQRLAWLEEVLLLAHQSGALPIPRDPWTGLRLPRTGPSTSNNYKFGARHLFT